MDKRAAKLARRAAQAVKQKTPAIMAKQVEKPPAQKPQKQRDIMKISKAKDLFEYGIFRGVEIHPKPMSHGWLVCMISKEGEKLILETDRGETRVFKTLDTAFKASQDIGFETALVARKKANLHQ